MIVGFIETVWTLSDFSAYFWLFSVFCEVILCKNTPLYWALKGLCQRCSLCKGVHYKEGSRFSVGPPNLSTKLLSGWLSRQQSPAQFPPGIAGLQFIDPAWGARLCAAWGARTNCRSWAACRQSAAVLLFSRFGKLEILGSNYFSGKFFSVFDDWIVQFSTFEISWTWFA